MITSLSTRQESAPADFFSRIDTDSDGQLTADELKADFETHIKQAAGAATGAEAPPAPDFAQMIADGDTDGDGTLSDVEFTTAMQARHHRPPPPPPATSESEESTSLDDAIAALDSDGDGKLSANELQAAYLEKYIKRTEDAEDATDTAEQSASAALEQPDFQSLVSLADTDGDGLLGNDELATLVTDSRRSTQPPPRPMDPRFAEWNQGAAEATSRALGQG